MDLQTFTDRYNVNLHKACSANFCDNLLVETAIFAIIGVLFCVTQKALNFIEIKKTRT